MVYIYTYCNIVTTSALCTYLQGKHGWSDETFECIDWKTYQQSKNSIDQRDLHIVKLMHDILPMAKHSKTYNCTLSDKCTFCNQHVETRDHLLQCGSSECTKWCKTLLAYLHRQMKLLHMKPSLIELLIKNLKNWFKDLPADCQNMPIDI